MFAFNSVPFLGPQNLSTRPKGYTPPVNIHTVCSEAHAPDGEKLRSLEFRHLFFMALLPTSVPEIEEKSSY